MSAACFFHKYQSQCGIDQTVLDFTFGLSLPGDTLTSACKVGPKPSNHRKIKDESIVPH